MHFQKPRDCFSPIIYTDLNNITWYQCGGYQYQFNANKNSFELKEDFKLDFSKLNYTKEALWANDERFSKIENNKAYPTFTKNILNGEGVFFLIEEGRRMWISISNKSTMKVFDVSKWKKNKPLNPEDCLIAEDNNVGSMKVFKDNTGLVWVGLNGHGIRKYSFESEKFHHKAKAFSVKKIIINKNNEIYLESWASRKKLTEDGSLVDNVWVEGKTNIMDYHISKTGDLWLTKRNDGSTEAISELEQINLITKKSKIFKVELKGKYGHDQQFMEDRHGNMWIGGYGGVFAVFDPISGTTKEYSLITDRSNALSDNELITAFYEDNSGTEWIGTDAGFAKIECSNIINDAPKITWYKTDSKNKNSLNDGHVTTLLDDPLNNNILWISTKGGGVNMMEKSSAKFTHITTNQGLCNNVVYGILPDKMGNIWGSTNNGLFCILSNKVRNNNFEIRHFSEAAGLQAAEFNTGAFAKFPNGDLAFGGINGINVFNPMEILRDSFAPNIFITNFLVNNKLIKPNDESNILQQAIEYTKTIYLNYKQDEFTLEFSSLDFRAPDQNKYRYQLVGIDKEWVESGKRRTVNYLHLPAGRYLFRVQGSNSQGIWSHKKAELTIIIMPPWWFTWWAYLIYALLLGFGIRTYFRFRINQAKIESQLGFEQKESKRILELDAIKTKLYANITHEFRTPLTVILGMANQVKSNPEKNLDAGVEMIVRNGESLLNLVNEMLDLSKLEGGKMNLHLTNGDIISFLRYMVESFHSLASSQQKQFHFLANLNELIVTFDQEKIRQVVSNLLSNALKFTPIQGNIYISISNSSHADNNMEMLTIKVKDTGIGIPENQVHHIFDRFYQLDNSHTRKTGGTGIGLSLTKELVKLMNGSIEVKSPPIGAIKGAEFIVSIPMQKSNLDEVNAELKELAYRDFDNILAKVGSTFPANINIDIKNSNQPLILLVEDNADVVAYTASCLLDYNLIVGKDGIEGLETAVKAIPDLIITDVMMPYVDGFEMCQKLRQDERTSHIPIIMLTARADMQSKLEGIEKGADIYLEKPFHKGELLLRIRKLLELRKNLQQYYSSQIGLTQISDVLQPQNNENLVVEKTEHAFVKKVRELVESNFNNHEFSVEQLCTLVFMSHSQLHRKLEAITGYSPNKFIRIVRLSKSKHLLTDLNLSIATVAIECGYPDSGYFARVFKQDTGLTPQEWRGRNVKSLNE